ncbi:MAG: hypothetical protein F6K55_21310 [Moorea sp. SIO4A3]|nr:hypothetical protein [Moorena sp. SIO4A3]
MSFNSEEDIAQHLIEFLSNDKEGQALLQDFKSNALDDESISKALRNTLQAYFHTEVSGGQVDKIVNIARAHVVNVLLPKLKPEPQNIPGSGVKFNGRELDIETLHQLLKEKGRVVIYSEANSTGKTELARKYAQLAWKKKVYPGGICWLNGKRSDLKDQLIEFAKSKLELPIPEDLDLASKVNDFWSKWSKDDVLIVIDNVSISKYERLIDFIPLEDQHFTLLITIPDKSVDDRLLNDNFETLDLSPPEKDFFPSADEDTKDTEDNFIYVLLTTVILLVIVSGISVFVSYEVVDSEPWKTEFTENGWVVELLRSFLYFLGEIWIVFRVFRQDTREFFGLESPSSEYRKARNAVRLFAIAITIAAMVIVPYYHLYIAPERLASDWKEITDNKPELNYIELESPQGLRAYILPYRIYLVYSLANYIVLWLPILISTSYSALKDFTFLHEYRKRIGDKQNKIANLRYRQSFVFSPVDICNKIQDNFTNFSRMFVEKIGNYTSVFLVFCLGVTFELVAGRYTLAEKAIVWLFVGYIVWAVGILVFLLGYSYYENALQESRNLLLRVGCENLQGFEEENKVTIFISRVFDTYFSLYLGLIIIAVGLAVFGLAKVFD